MWENIKAFASKYLILRVLLSPTAMPALWSLSGIYFAKNYTLKFVFSGLLLLNVLCVIEDEKTFQKEKERQ